MMPQSSLLSCGSLGVVVLGVVGVDVVQNYWLGKCDAHIIFDESNTQWFDAIVSTTISILQTLWMNVVDANHNNCPDDSEGGG